MYLLESTHKNVFVFLIAFGIATASLANSLVEEQPKVIYMNLDAIELFQKTNRFLCLADERIAIRDFEKANSYLKEGLFLLGDSYAVSDILDDTGIKLVLADLDEKKGEIENAVYIRRRMLSARLEIFKKKISKGTK